jgi:putative nucleotidyltransferase with HDIG domain
MMRSSEVVDCSTIRSPVRAIVAGLARRVNRKLTELSTKAHAAKAEAFFARYRYPDWLATHSRLVGRIAAALVGARRPGAAPLDADLVVLAAYLHDIGRSPLVEGDPRDHTTLGALILSSEGLAECGELARRHAIYCVLDPEVAPRTDAEKLVYVADRRGGQEIESLEDRAKDTARRHPRYAAEIERAVPLAKAIEREVFAALTFGPDELVRHVH